MQAESMGITLQKTLYRKDPWKTGWQDPDASPAKQRQGSIASME